MKAKELLKLGYPQGPLIGMARAVVGEARLAGRSNHQIRAILRGILVNPSGLADDPVFGRLAQAVTAAGIVKTREPLPEDWSERTEGLSYRVWGEDIDPGAHEQMRNACRLPVSVAAALMPDAHVGYGLPIGGVLATHDAVIPYAVGVDIACRMMLTVFDLPPRLATDEEHRFRGILEKNTVFGVGARWKPPREHPVMDEDWNVTPVTARLKDLARHQLGTSGSGNHFVEFGEIEFMQALGGVAAGRYLAVLSHSGSRGPGSQVASHYSKAAMSQRGKLPRELRHLAWLSMRDDGQEYWAAMELMGRFASANHHVIHRQIVAAVGERPIIQVENHHNFAWRERHQGREVIVHRKGATPAARGVLGVIPGSMAAPGYLVEGLGEPASLESASHGAGRRMSRTQAISQFRWPEVNKYLREKGVTLISGGLDEVPWAYKDIDAVMAAQTGLVRPIARFMPRLVKMCPAGERPED